MTEGATPASPAAFHDEPRLPRGFSCASTNVGLKERDPDLALFVSEVEADAAAIFTKSLFPAASVLVGRELIKAGRLRAIVVNSKLSNVGTGDVGIANAHRLGAAAGRAIGTSPATVLMSSTGVIGVQLPIERLEAGVATLPARLQGDPRIGARGMMTTDTYPKAVSLSIGEAVLTLVAKGAGMIEPNMATMLVYIFTDAALPGAQLRQMLADAAYVSFNMLSIDTDTSTSDTCVLMANGLGGPVPQTEFAAALQAGCVRMAELLARDGEGATKLLRAHVRGALDETEARRVAKAVINSPLIKTMAYGADPNVGRVLMAVGKCFECAVDPARLTVKINDTVVFTDSLRTDFDEPRLRAELSGDPVDIHIDLGIGSGRATAFGCDLTEGYIKENAAYYSS